MTENENYPVIENIQQFSLFLILFESYLRNSCRKSTYKKKCSI